MSYFTTHLSFFFADEIFLIGEHLAKLQAKWLIVSCAPFALHFRPQRCWSRQINWITYVLRTETVTIVDMLIGRLMWVNYQVISNCCRTVLTDWRRHWVSDWPTADHVCNFAATDFLCCGSSVHWVMGYFICPM